jgi:hypothetical protein
MQTGALALCTNMDRQSIIVASVRGSMPQPYHIQLVTIGLNGAITSQKWLNTPDSFNVYRPQRMIGVNDGFIITGQYAPLDTTMPQYFFSLQPFTLKIDLSGNLVWNNNVDDGMSKLGEDICPGPGNTVIVANDACNGDNCQILASSRGNIIYRPIIGVSFDFLDVGTGVLSKTINYISNNYMASPYITYLPGNGYITVVTDNFEDYAPKIRLTKTDDKMNEIWQHKMNIPYPARPFGVLSTDDQGYIIFASVQTFGDTRNDIAVIKIDANGEIKPAY